MILVFGGPIALKSCPHPARHLAGQVILSPAHALPRKTLLVVFFSIGGKNEKLPPMSRIRFLSTKCQDFFLTPRPLGT